MPAAGGRSGPTALSLAVATLAALGPFLGKAVHIDDPLFLWAARHIQRHPLDFYGFSVNWYGVEMPMAEVTKNPPLAAHYLALVGAALGWTELALHAAFLLPAVGAVLGTYALARRLCPRPLLGAVVSLVSPVFLVSGTTLMCDVMMLALFVWAVVLWLRGVDGDAPGWLAAAAVLAAAAALTKYFAVALIPLLAAYAVAARRRAAVAWLAVPVVVLLGYQWLTLLHYGRGLLWDAATYATDVQQARAVGALARILTGLAFLGGSLLTAVIAVRRTWSARGMVLAGLAVTLAVLALARLATPRTGPLVLLASPAWPAGLQLALLALVGVHVLALAGRDAWRTRDPGGGLLALWVAGTFVFATFVTAGGNARSILPMAPAVGILVARAGPSPSSGRLGGGSRVVLGAAAVLSLLVAGADYRLAGSARDAAGTVARRFGEGGRTLWFQGHWGFQYYLERLGGRPLDRTRSRLVGGDTVVVPENNTNPLPVPRDAVTLREVLIEPGPRLLTTMSVPLGAGFYYDVWGPLPFAVGAVPAERYRIYRVERDVALGTR